MAMIRISNISLILPLSLYLSKKITLDVNIPTKADRISPKTVGLKPLNAALTYSDSLNSFRILCYQLNI